MQQQVVNGVPVTLPFLSFPSYISPYLQCTSFHELWIPLFESHPSLLAELLSFEHQEKELTHMLRQRAKALTFSTAKSLSVQLPLYSEKLISPTTVRIAIHLQSWTTPFSWATICYIKWMLLSLHCCLMGWMNSPSLLQLVIGYQRRVPAYRSTIIVRWHKEELQALVRWH